MSQHASAQIANGRSWRRLWTHKLLHKLCRSCSTYRYITHSDFCRSCTSGIPSCSWFTLGFHGGAGSTVRRKNAPRHAAGKDRMKALSKVEEMIADASLITKAQEMDRVPCFGVQSLVHFVWSLIESYGVTSVAFFCWHEAPST